MGNNNITNKPDLTIVGGQPHKRRNSQGKVQVPVGLEKILFHAARDDGFKKLLLADRVTAIEKSGVSLRPSERAMISVATDDTLEAMIAKINPSNPKKRKFMGLVAAAATSLAAGTALIAGGCEAQVEKTAPGLDAGTGSDTDVDSDSDTVDTFPEDTSVDGIRPDTDSDTDTDTDTDTDSDGDAGGDSGDTDMDSGL